MNLGNVSEQKWALKSESKPKTEEKHLLHKDMSN